MTLDVAAIRNDFPILSQDISDNLKLVYLDNAATTQKPHVVISKIADYYSTINANVHRGIHTLADRATEALENARRNIAAFLNARQSEEIIFTSGTTHAINLAAQGWARNHLQAGDEILISLMEHHANFVPWQQAAQQTGAVLKIIPVSSSGDWNNTAYEELLNEKTRLVAITAMSNMLGTITPIRAIIEHAHRVGARVLIDGAQIVTHEKVNLQELGADFFAFSGHKMFGPTGIGVLYTKSELQEEMQPMLFGGNMISEVFEQHSTWAEPPAKFEAGTLPIAGAIGLGSAVEYLSQLDMSEIQQHETALTEYALKQLNQISGIKILGPAESNNRGPIISFTMTGVHPHDLSSLVNIHGVAIRAGHHCTMPLHNHLGIVASSRISFSIYNTQQEIDVLIDAIHSARKRLKLS